MGDAGAKVVLRVRSAETDAPLAGVEVYTTQDEGPSVLVDSSSTPESIAASEAESGEVARSATTLTDAIGVATLQDPLLATNKPLFLVFQKAGYFSEVHQRE